MDGVTIVFEGVQRSGWAKGGLQVSGYGKRGGTLGKGERAFSWEYAKGVTDLRFGKREFQIRDRGRTLRIQGVDVDLSEGKKRVVVSKDGVVRVADRMVTEAG